jgi:hypothetical protein
MQKGLLGTCKAQWTEWQTTWIHQGKSSKSYAQFPHSIQSCSTICLQVQLENCHAEIQIQSRRQRSAFGNPSYERFTIYVWSSPIEWWLLCESCIMVTASQVDDRVQSDLVMYLMNSTSVLYPNPNSPSRPNRTIRACPAFIVATVNNRPPFSANMCLFSKIHSSQ